MCIHFVVGLDCWKVEKKNVKTQMQGRQRERERENNLSANSACGNTFEYIHTYKYM